MTLGDISRGAILDKYRHSNKDTLFYLKPDSTDIYLMDFKVNKFIKEQITGIRVPYKAST